MPKAHYYNTCPQCGAALDPGERCDCEKSTSMELDATDRRALEIFRALPPEGQDFMMALTKALLQQQSKEGA